VSRVAARFLIEGRVQGVWFRASTQQQARRLGVTGHAINLADGRVEVLALGDAEAVRQLAEWLGHGPPQADVQRVERQALPAGAVEAVDDFTTG